MTHHPDCDWYCTAHATRYVETVRSALDGSIGYRECEECDWRYPTCGSRPRSTEDTWPTHARSVECDGRCLSWT